jgi:hypothetical protein
MAEQPLLAIDPPRITRQRPARRNHPMTGHDDRQGISAIGGPHGPRSAGEPQVLGKIAVGAGLAVGDLAQEVPNLVLELGANWSQRQVKALAIARKIVVELGSSCLEGLGLGILVPAGAEGWIVFLLGEVDAREGLPIAGEQQWAEGAVVVGEQGHGGSLTPAD